MKRAWCLCLCALSACIPAHIVATDARLVRPAVDALEFQVDGKFAPRGLWQSVDIRGEAAAALRRIWYWFRADGTYSAVALCELDAVSFQLRDGTWSLQEFNLVLDGGEPAELMVAGDHLRIRTATGSVILRKEPLE